MVVEYVRRSAGRRGSAEVEDSFDDLTKERMSRTVAEVAV